MADIPSELQEYKYPDGVFSIIFYNGYIWVKADGVFHAVGKHCQEKWLTRKGDRLSGLVITWKGGLAPIKSIRQEFMFRGDPEMSRQIPARANVCAIVITPDGTTFLGVSKSGPGNPGTFLFPAGKVEPTDDGDHPNPILCSAAERELCQEIGITMKGGHAIICYDPTIGRILSPKESDVTCVTVPVFLIGKVIGDPKPDGREFIDVKELSVTGLDEKLSRLSNKIWAYVAECLFQTDSDLNETYEMVKEKYPMIQGELPSYIF